MKNQINPDVRWRKSSHSGPTGGECVELAGMSDMVAVRDSKNPKTRHLTFDRAAFGRLVREIRSGHHDL
ncbi:DUF397 domain-containing protein [Actinocorallia libanotica]|uniref:DUF397 domain-containing protein n=1 Tax=Actinocorallia libanotica TaxID=46162 RepID=A0ABN1QBN5_9ACTN